MMDQENNLFQKYSVVTDDDDDFEIGELENFNLDMIAPKQETKMDFNFDEFSEDTLLCNDESAKKKNDGHNLKSIFELFEN